MQMLSLLLALITLLTLRNDYNPDIAIPLNNLPLGYAWVATPDLVVPGPTNRIFLAQGDTVTATDLQNGASYWSFQAHTAGQTTKIQAIAASDNLVMVLALSSPTAVSGPYQRILIQLDAHSGVARWQRQLTGEMLNFQVGAPPMLWLDAHTVYHIAIDLNSNPTRSELSAYNLTNGELLWRQPGCERVWGLLGKVLVATCQDALVRIDARTGQQLPLYYKRAIPSAELTEVQLVRHDQLDLAVLAYAHQRDWQQRIHTDVEIAAYDLKTGQLQWWHKRTGQLGGMVLHDAALAFRIGPTVLQVNVATGAPQWRTDLPEQTGSGLVLVDNQLFTSSDVSILHALDWQSGKHGWEADLATTLKPVWWNMKWVQATPERLALLVEYYQRSGNLHQTALIVLGAAGRSTWPISLAPPQPIPTPSPTPFSPDELRQQIQAIPDAEAGNLPGVESAGQAKTSFRALRSDLDGDGTAEWLVTSNYLRVRQGLAGTDPQAPPSCNGEHLLCQSTFVIFGQDPQRPGWFSPVHFVQFNEWSHLQWWEPEIIAVQDLNHDDKPEIVLAYQNCGASTCIKEVQVGQWDGRHWANLTSIDNSPQDALVLSEPEITVTDPDGDQVYEIRLHGGIVDSSGAGIQRKRTQIYRYSSGSYHWVTTMPDPDNDIYFLLQDAHHALAQGEFARAQVLSQQIRTWWEAQPDPKSATVLLTPNAAERITTYGAILGILAAAEQQQPNLGQTIFEWIETRHAELNNPYVGAAERLWQVYQTTGDVKVACQAMARRVREQIQDAEFYSWYGYNMEYIDLRLDACPLSVH